MEMEEDDQEVEEATGVDLLRVLVLALQGLHGPPDCLLWRFIETKMPKTAIKISMAWVDNQFPSLAWATAHYIQPKSRRFGNQLIALVLLNDHIPDELGYIPQGLKLHPLGFRPMTFVRWSMFKLFMLLSEDQAAFIPWFELFGNPDFWLHVKKLFYESLLKSQHTRKQNSLSVVSSASALNMRIITTFCHRSGCGRPKLVSLDLTKTTEEDLLIDCEWKRMFYLIMYLIMTEMNPLVKFMLNTPAQCWCDCPGCEVTFRAEVHRRFGHRGRQVRDKILISQCMQFQEQVPNKEQDPHGIDWLTREIRKLSEHTPLMIKSESNKSGLLSIDLAPDDTLPQDPTMTKEMCRADMSDASSIEGSSDDEAEASGAAQPATSRKTRLYLELGAQHECKRRVDSTFSKYEKFLENLGVPSWPLDRATHMLVWENAAWVLFIIGSRFEKMYDNDGERNMDIEAPPTADAPYTGLGRGLAQVDENDKLVLDAQGVPLVTKLPAGVEERAFSLQNVIAGAQAFIARYPPELVILNNLSVAASRLMQARADRQMKALQAYGSPAARRKRAKKRKEALSQHVRISNEKRRLRLQAQTARREANERRSARLRARALQKMRMLRV